MPKGKRYFIILSNYSMNNIKRQIGKMKEHNQKDDSIFAAYISESNIL